MKNLIYYLLALAIFSGFYACVDEKNTDESVMSRELTIEPDSIGIKAGDSVQLIAKRGGVVLQNSEVIWNINNPSYLKISENGVVTALKESESKDDLQVRVVLRSDVAKYGECKVRVVGDNKKLYRLVLKDKGESSGIAVSSFLSADAIARRNKYGIGIVNNDYPISKEYMTLIQAVGGEVVTKSKWMNTVVVALDNDSLVKKYKALTFVSDVVLVGNVSMVKLSEKQTDTKSSMTQVKNNIATVLDYGEASRNIDLHKGQAIHNSGYKGASIKVAVIDNGFYQATTNPMLRNSNIKGTYIFPYNFEETASDVRGVSTLANMATNQLGKFVGTAPEANYYLLTTEVSSSEQPVEEDYLVAALEYADSVGVQIANVSAYYKSFNTGFTSYTAEQMDGKTAFSTRATNVATEKGILVICAAGNENSWVGAPAESPNVLTVGGVYEDGMVGFFTSFGKTADGRSKPDIVSLGMKTATISADGSIIKEDGTTYATPIISGLAACLWQAYPNLTNMQIIDILKKSGNRVVEPKLQYGYGMPDIEKAMELAKNIQ